MTTPLTVYFRNLHLDSPLSAPIHRYPYGVAYFSASRWWYSGVSFGGSAEQVPITQQDLPSLKAWILGVFGDPEPQESNYRPGTAFKRISLPLNIAGSLISAIDLKAMTQSFVALKILLAKMQDIFETVEPGLENSQAYGQKIRELLLLASMEVEASWTAVLKANGYIGDRFTTKDYVKLKAPMLLDGFGLKLVSYPDFPDIEPFKDWTELQPTQSLSWYHAYNRTKHNREEQLDCATLKRAVDAVGGAVVMFYAQFGYSFRNGDEKSTFLRSVFMLGVDHSMYPTSCYIPNAEGGTRAWDWELLDYPFTPS